MDARLFLRASMAVFVLGSFAVVACGGDDDGNKATAHPGTGPGADGGPPGEGEPPKPPRTNPVVSDAHPRIFFSTGNKDRLTAKLAAPEGKRFKDMVDDELGGKDQYNFEQWNAALVGYLTGDAKYCSWAVQKTDDFVKGEEATIAKGDAPDVANDSYLQIGPDIGSLAMVYDWCFASLSDDQKTRWQTYADQAVWNVWNHENAKWGGTKQPWDGWSVDNPYNNYHYSFLRASMLWGLAAYKELPSAPGWVDLVRKDKLEKLFAGYNQNIIGGGSREGTGYGLSQRELFEIYDFWEASTTERIWDLTPSTRLSVPHFIHTTVPTMDRVAPIGDQARDSTASFFDYHREQVLVLQHLLGAGDPLGDIAQTYLEGVSVKEMGQFFEYVWDFLYADPNHAKQPLEKLNPTYYGPGTGFTFFRSNWQNDATWGSLIGGPYTESHAHRDQGSLMIYKNHWLAFDETVDSHSGIDQDEETHNLVRLVSGGKTLQQQSEKNPGQTVALSSDANYVYWSGKLDPLYGDPKVSKVERDVVFVKALETFVVFDRIDSTVTSAVWSLNSTPTPTKSGNKWSLTEQGSTLDIFPLLPAGATAAVVPWGGSDFETSSRLDITAGPKTRFLTVLAPGGRVQNATTSSSGGNSIATVTFAGGATGTFTFSTDGNGGHVTVNGGGVTIDAALATTVQQLSVLQ